jgi:hypothetical protein
VSYTEFNQKVFKNPSIKWFDRIGIMEINNNRLAEITLAEGHYSGSYIKYQVRILHKDYGVITTKDFMFKDYLHLPAKTDSWGDIKNFFVTVKDNSYVDWHLSPPSEDDLKRLTDAITDYIDCFW